ncbi:leucine-rich repeat, cysteine-containing subtype protein [Tanacetum coccineum]
MELLARPCPNLQQLRFSLVEEIDPHKEDNEASEFDFDFDDDGLCVVANSCSRLNEVDLSGSVTDESFKAIGELNSLRHLCLGGCLISDLGLEYMANGNLKNCLQKFHMDKCDNVSDESLKSIGELIILRHLCLGGCKISDLGLDYMAKGNLRNFLQKLHIDKCDNVCGNGVSYLKQMSKLTYMNLSGCESVTDESLKSIGELELLRHLCLGGCKISDVGLEYMTGICRNFRGDLR